MEQTFQEQKKTTEKCINPSVFISYSWDSEDHKSWVISLAQKLVSNGVDVKLDQWDTKPGESLTHYMEKEVVEATYVVVICTPEYAMKSNERAGGVGYEQQIVSGQLFSGIPRTKFIPIIRSGSFAIGKDCAIPSHFSGIYTLDFTTDQKIEENFENLIRTIFEEPKLVKPPIGKRPKFRNPVVDEEVVASDTCKVYTFTLSSEFELDEDFELLEAKLYDINKDLTSKNSFKIDVEIEGVSKLRRELVNKFSNPITNDEIKERHRIRTFLDKFNINNREPEVFIGDLIKIIIENFSSKGKYGISSFGDTALLLNKSILLYSPSRINITEGKKFDVYYSKKSWATSIKLSDEEVNQLLISQGTSNIYDLTDLWGLTVANLSSKVIIEKVYPAVTFEFLRLKHNGKINEIAPSEFFDKILSWSVGLA